MFTDRILLITGGTGTFGNAVLRRFLDTSIASIRILSRDERKQEEMRLSYGNPKLQFYIGDVRAADSVQPAMAGADLVFHAAALKQVPSCEFFPLEAIRTNTLGTDNVLASAVQNRIGRTIVLSTDKAVYPINAMGMSKALMEKLMVARSATAAASGTILCGTRYGNVMGSRGSVIPLFIRQIKEGKPLTVTDPHMTRFMMSIDDALDLVLHAFEHGKPGDLFVQRAPAATIATLAEALKRIFGATNPTVVIGTRHGEKLYETLLTREERARAEETERYFRVPADGRGMNYNLYFTEGEQRVSEQEDYNSHNTRRLDVEELVEILLQLECVSSELAGAPA
jgi:UDP-N-acetylglucosamine 4,6-dehydratase/5-epimerase